MDPTISCGLFQTGGLRFAIPAEAIVEVVSGPFPLSPLPGAGEVVSGIAVVRGRPVPVVDFSCWLPPEADPAVGLVPRVVLLSWAGGRVAVRIDEVLRVGMFQESGAAEVVGDAGLASVIFRRWIRVDAVAAGLLDPETLLAIPGIRHGTGGDDLRHGAVADCDPGEAGKVVPHVVFQVGDTRFAIEAEWVAGAHRIGEFQRHGLSGGLVRGFAGHRGQLVAVLDPGVFLGLPPLVGPMESGTFLLLQSGGRTLGCAIGALIGMVSLDRTGLLPSPDLRHPEVVRGLRPLDGTGDVLFLDAKALLEHPEVLPLTAIDVSQAGAGDDVGDGGETTGYLLYRVGASAMASPLRDLGAVLTPPETWMPLPDAVAGLLGTFTWQGRTLPLVDLSVLLGGSPERSASRRVLVSETADGLAGIVVSEVESLQMARRLEVPWRRGGTVPGGPGRVAVPPVSHMIRIAGGTRWRNVSVFDVRNLRLPSWETSPEDARWT